VVECGATDRKHACVATDGRGDGIELPDQGMSVASRGDAREAHVTAADGTRLVVRVVAPERAAGHAGISAETAGERRRGPRRGRSRGSGALDSPPVPRRLPARENSVVGFRGAAPPDPGWLGPAPQPAPLS
jgi:hypothetical protein